MDRAYYCFCTAERLDAARSEQQAAGKPTMYDRHCRGLDTQAAQQRIAQDEPHVVRLKLPLTGEVTFSDIIRGQVTFQWADVDDQVIIKSDGFPTYHLAAMCDDHDMMITHVIRAEEWISSTPKHLFIYESFGWKLPAFAHLPLLLNADRSKLSKRQGDVAVEDYLSKGYLPEVLLNFVALLGWNPSAEQEIYTHEELIAAFDLSKVNKAGAIFNIEKLDWLNAQYMKALPEHTYLELTRPHVDASPKHDATFIDRCLLLVRDRAVLPSNVKNLTNFFFQEHLEYQNVSLTWKTQPKAEAIERLEGIRTWMEDQSEAIFMDAPTVEQCLRVLMVEKGWGNGDTLWPLRVALSAQEKSPGPFDLLVAYGKERSLARLNDALKFLSLQA
jgi:glutamyl-tRNA synthetase